MANAGDDVKGHCLCGAVQFTAKLKEPHAHACHCNMCRRWSGGPMFGVAVDDLTFSDPAAVSAYKSSEWAERVFCKTCGSNMAWRAPEMGFTAVPAFAFDPPVAITLESELYIDEKPATYDLAGERTRMTAAEVEALFASAT